MEEVGRRLRDVRGILGIRNQDDMATKLSVPLDMIVKISAGMVSPSDDFLQRLEQRLRVSRHWLMTGEGAVLLRNPDGESEIINRVRVSRDVTSEIPSTEKRSQGEGAKIPEREAIEDESIQDIHGEDSQMIPNLQFQQLPVVTFKVAAGMEPFSTDNLDSKQPYITISQNSGESRTDLVAIRVVGTNMDPTIRDGAIACVDRGDKTIVPTDIYAVHNGQGKGAVRRLTVVPGGLVLLSDNREHAFENLELSPGKKPEDFVIGKVIWVWQSFV